MQGVLPREIAEFMDVIAPPEMAEDWDNCGLLVDAGRRVQRVLVCLDIKPEVVQEAVEKKCDMIISHHPVIFKPIRNIAAGHPVFALVQAGISAYCAHTSLDAAVGGVNDVLAEKLALHDVNEFMPMGRIGSLPKPMTAVELAAYCGQRLEADVRYADAGKMIETVAVVGGSGASFLTDAAASGVDCLVTGDAGHHDALDAVQMGISLIAAGHYSTEFPAMPMVAGRLGKQFPDIEMIVSTRDKVPFATWTMEN